MSPAPRALRLVAVLVALLSGGTALADRTAAEFFAQRGDKAAKEKDWSGAQGHYRKALEEDPTFLPARLGLAEALLSTGDRAAGLDELRKVADAAGAPGGPPAWAALGTRARKRLEELDVLGTQLNAIAEKHVSDLLSLAEKWVEKDPELAAAALGDVLRLRPGNPRALAALAKAGKPAPNGAVRLFDGKDKKGWLYLDPPHWSVEGGEIRADMTNEAMVIRSELSAKGDFDVRVEARVLEEAGEAPMFAVRAAMKGDYRCSTFGILITNVVWQEESGEGKFDTRFTKKMADLPKPCDPKAWTWYEMRFHGDKIDGVINGNVVTTQDRLPDRDEGFIGIHIQHMKAAIRQIEVVQH